MPVAIPRTELGVRPLNWMCVIVCGINSGIGCRRECQGFWILCVCQSLRFGKTSSICVVHDVWSSGLCFLTTSISNAWSAAIQHIKLHQPYSLQYWWNQSWLWRRHWLARPASCPWRCVRLQAERRRQSQQEEHFEAAGEATWPVMHQSVQKLVLATSVHISPIHAGQEALVDKDFVHQMLTDLSCAVEALNLAAVGAATDSLRTYVRICSELQELARKVKEAKKRVSDQGALLTEMKDLKTTVANQSDNQLKVESLVEWRKDIRDKWVLEHHEQTEKARPSSGMRTAWQELDYQTLMQIGVDQQTWAPILATLGKIINTVDRQVRLSWDQAERGAHQSRKYHNTE